MRELLVRYLLGELSPGERDQLEAKLRDSPELQRELAYLRACFATDEQPAQLPSDSVPTGLAERTLGKVSGHPSSNQPATASDIAAAYDPPAGSPSWSLADITVAGGVFLAISMLFLPALRQSRDAARRTGCADNMRQLGTMLAQYSEVHGGYFPKVKPNQNAGIFAVYLLDGDLATADELPRLLLCRSSPLAEDVTAKRVFIRVPTMAELEEATAKDRCMWKRLMGGSYAYHMGFVEGGKHRGVRNEGSCHKALLADAPGDGCQNKQSVNHGGDGQNVLYQSGRVEYQLTTTIPGVDDDEMYLNSRGEEAAGLGSFDTVLGRSGATPERAGLDQSP